MKVAPGSGSTSFSLNVDGVDGLGVASGTEPVVGERVGVAVGSGHGIGKPLLLRGAG